LAEHKVLQQDSICKVAAHAASSACEESTAGMHLIALLLMHRALAGRSHTPHHVHLVVSSTLAHLLDGSAPEGAAIAASRAAGAASLVPLGWWSRGWG
jgi:hypothetical protein